MPGEEGHLLFCNGPEESEDLIEGVFISTDAGESWTEISNTDKILNVSAGKSAPNSSYPTVFVCGEVNGDYGYHMSIDQGQSWSKIGEYPLGLYDWPAVMEGDMNVHGRLYIGFNGNGFVYHNLEDPLPVSFIDPLSGVAKAGENHLFWRTGEELGLGYFEVQRSSENEEWTEIGRVPSEGDAELIRSYTYVDQDPGDGTNYYRLKAIDLDDSYSYTNVVAIQTMDVKRFEISPNPVRDKLTLTTDIENGKVKLMDISSRVVLSVDLTLNQEIDVAALPAGVYFIQITDEWGRSFSERLIKH